MPSSTTERVRSELISRYSIVELHEAFAIDGERGMSKVPTPLT